MWCAEGPIRDQLLMQKAWAGRKGAMPEPRPLVLPELPAIQKGEEGRAFSRFMDAFGGESIARVELPSRDVVHVQRKLFQVRDGDKWKIGNRGRDRWLLYIAELIKAPQEVWKFDLGMSQELYLLGRFQRGNQRVDVVAVFKRDSDVGEWTAAKTAYAFDKPDGIDRKRLEIFSGKACIRWIQE